VRSEGDQQPASGSKKAAKIALVGLLPCFWSLVLMVRFCSLVALVLALGLAGCNSGPGQLASAPEAPVIAIVPDEPGSNESLEVQLVTESVDPDGDLVGYRYRWTLDGEAREDLDDAALIPAILTARDQVWEVRVSGYDQMGHVGSPATASATIMNSPPTAQVSVSPNPAGTDSDLALEVITDDADGDAVSLSIGWARNGVTSTSYDGLLVIPSNFTDEGDDWSVHVTPFDGIEEGEAQVVTVHVGNAAPVVSHFAISPENPREGDTISASATVTDVDGDWVTVAYQWFVDGVLVSGEVSTAFSSEHFDKHQEVWAEVVATDSKGTSGEPVESNHVVVENTPPSIDSVEISPATGGEEATFTCIPVGWADPDPADQTQDLALQWLVGGVESVTTESISGSEFDKHDSLRCRVTPSDVDAVGVAQDSPALEVSNTPPTATSVALVSSESSTVLAYETSTLTAVPSGYADVDPQDATEGWQFQWLVDGQPISASADTLTGADFDRDQEVQVLAFPFDGEDPGASVSSGTITILNTAPSVDSVGITPDPAYTNTPLTAVPVGWDDPDDAPSFHYAWTVAGSTAGTNSEALSSSEFQLGDSVQVTITPDDGTAQGTPRTSSVLVISDAYPEEPAVSILPVDPVAGVDDLLCTYVASNTDPDGHSVSHAIRWELDGTPFSGMTTTTEANDTIATSHTVIGQEWTCAVSSTDSQNLATIGESSVLLRIPDFSLQDLNSTSASSGSMISPRDYLNHVSAWYFGDSQVSSSVLEFNCLEDIQADLDANYASLAIEILGINIIGGENGNPFLTSLVSLPWLQDDSSTEVADLWSAAQRDLVILDEENLPIQRYSLASHNICESAEASALLNLLVTSVSPSGDDDDSASSN